MSARRITKTKKILDLIEAIIDETGVFCSYPELRRRLRGRWCSKLPQAIDNLRRQGYLEIVENDNAKAIKLTAKGKVKAFLPRFRKDWDGRWRILAFDIEEKRRKSRDLFRENLELLGFKYLQKSLWITPYDVSEQIEELIDLLGLEENICYFIADAITGKDDLVEKFKLYQPKQSKAVNRNKY